MANATPDGYLFHFSRPSLSPHPPFFRLLYSAFLRSPLSPPRKSNQGAWGTRDSSFWWDHVCFWLVFLIFVFKRVWGKIGA